MTRAQRARLRAIILALCFAASMGVAAAQSAPLISVPFSLSAVGAGPAIGLGGQSSCSLALSNAGVGLTLIPQASSDYGVTWVTASTVGGGSIGAVGTYTGNIGGTALTSFRFIISALSSGTVSGQETCSSALGLADSGGVIGAVNVTQVGGASIALGQTTKSASLPVTIASDQGGLATTCTAATCAMNEAQLGGTIIGAPSAAGVSATGNIQGIQGVTGGLAVPVSGTFFQGTQPTSCASAATCPVNASQVGGPWTDNITQFGGVNISTGTGVGGAGIPRVTISNDSTHPVTQSGAFNTNQTIGTAGYSFLLDSAGTNKASINLPGAQLVAQGKTRFILTSGSATTCTNLQATAGTLVELVNVGSATAVFPAFYDDASNACATGARVYGNFTSLTLQAGQAIQLNIPLTAGLAYKLSGALSDNLVAVTN